MEKTVLQLQDEKQMGISLQMLSIGLGGVFIGMIEPSIAFALAFYYLAYFYMRDEKECRSAAIGILLGSLVCGIFTTYLYALGFTIFFINVHVLHLWKKNIYRLLPLVSALLCIPYGIFYFHFDVTAWLLPFGIYILMRLNDQNYAWIQKQFVCTSSMYGILIYSFTLVVLGVCPADLHVAILIGGFLAITFTSDLKVLVVLLIMNTFVYSSQMIPYEVMILFGMISLWKQSKKELLCGILLFGLVVQADMDMVLFLTLCAVLVCLYQEDILPFQIKEQVVDEPTISAQSILKRQIQNFSSIFQSLSQYYENISSVQSTMLSEMALALKYSADTLKKIELQENQKERILKVMEGYQYDVLKLDIEEVGEGNIALDMDIRNIEKSEIQQTLLPLMEVLTHEHLKVSTIKHHRFSNGYHHVSMENQVLYQIDAYADSQKNIYDSSGDSFSIFRFRNTVICMISDGMGSGEKAAASSRLITNIFQRMVFSGISKLDSIRCINKLLQSDAYATLDVICYDLSEGKAYIFKSAACPTFLIRENELFEVNGSSLPVGIISTMEPDCFVADLKEGDEYVMISDGIFMDEIYRWMSERTSEDAKTDCDTLMNILKERKRTDDSTAVLSKIKKADFHYS